MEGKTVLQSNKKSSHKLQLNNKKKILNKLHCFAVQYGGDSKKKKKDGNDSSKKLL